MEIEDTSGMTLLELPFIIAFLLICALGAKWLTHHFGGKGHPILVYCVTFISVFLVFSLFLYGIAKLFIHNKSNRNRVK